MNAIQIGVLALLLAASGFALLAFTVCQRLAAGRRAARTVEDRVAAYSARAAAMAAGEAERAQALRAAAAGATAPASAASGAVDSAGAAPGLAPVARRQGPAGVVDALAEAGARLLDTRAGRLIVAEEDRLVLDQCGYLDARSRGLFLMARVASALALAMLAAWLVVGAEAGRYPLAATGGGAFLGFMMPKVWLSRRAAARREAVANELPMFVDLLRLLQGVGLSLDQSLQVMINEFRRVLPVLASETEIAQRQFIAGRTREQSFQRISSIYENEDLRAVTRLLIQVDRHGGAVQEPLKQFGERLREVRRAALRERIGRVTVKMTGVMVVTLLPALMIVTAGPGLIAVMHSLSSIHRPAIHH